MAGVTTQQQHTFQLGELTDDTGNLGLLPPRVVLGPDYSIKDVAPAGWARVCATRPPSSTFSLAGGSLAGVPDEKGLGTRHA
jgi:hypothetical protein